MRKEAEAINRLKKKSFLAKRGNIIVKLKAFMCKLLLSIVMTFALSGCYSMPKEGVYSTIPTTNNPDVVGSHGSHMMMPSNAF